jgi:hypothetical protein
MRGDIPPLTNTPSRRGAQLKHRENFRELICEGNINRTQDEVNSEHIN